MSNELTREEYLRITHILAPFAGYGNIPKAVLQKAADRGTRAHTAINSLLSNIGDWGTEEDIEGYVNSAKKFFPRIGKIIHQETRFYDDKHHLTGQVDLIAEVDGIITLIDWKTSSKKNPTWSAQAGGYVQVAPKDIFKRAIFVKLDKEGGDPESHEFNNTLDVQDEFLACYALYNRYFKNNKLEIFE